MAQVSAEKLEHTWPAKKKSGLSATERAVGKCARAAFATKKEQSRLPKVPDRKGERVKVSESCTLARKEDQSGSIERKGWTPQ